MLSSGCTGWDPMLPNWLWPTPSWGNGLPSAIRVPVLMQIRPSMHKALTCSKYTEKEMPTLPCSTAGKRKTLRTHATYGSRLNSARTAQSRYPGATAGTRVPMGRTRRLLCRQRNIPIEWQAVCHQSRRAALSTYPQSLLGPTHQAMQGTGHEHHLPLCILELPRVSAGSVRLHRTE